MSMIEAVEKSGSYAGSWGIEVGLAVVIIFVLLGILGIQKIITAILTLRARADTSLPRRPPARDGDDSGPG